MLCYIFLFFLIKFIIILLYLLYNLIFNVYSITLLLTFNNPKARSLMQYLRSMLKINDYEKRSYHRCPIS